MRETPLGNSRAERPRSSYSSVRLGSTEVVTPRGVYGKLGAAMTGLEVGDRLELGSCKADRGAIFHLRFKLMLQGWVTVYRMIKVNGGFLNPEDANPGPANQHPRPGQLDRDDSVERSRRVQRNDLENIPAFLAAGWIFLLAEPPPLLLAQILCYGVVVARLAHSLAYMTARSHEMRATFFSLGSSSVLTMAGYSLLSALSRM